MNLGELIQRKPVPAPWEEGDNIPWNDPEFSARMLAEHLSQAHDKASRRFEKIDRQVAWIQMQLLAAGPARILDLGCGPGLYTSRLARLGHACIGIDFSPASITYARQQASQENLPCTYQQEDLRQAGFGQGFDLVMLIFGELNVFRPADARAILAKAWEALADGGNLLLEPHTCAAVEKMGRAPASWYSTEQGLFSTRPYLCLSENFWDETSQAAIKRHYIVETDSNQVTRYAQSLQAYTETQYQSLLEACGFTGVTFYPSLLGVADPEQNDMIAIVARKDTQA
jgi:SAM-dependent methyltransferase